MDLTNRPRRLRSSEAMRALTRETRLHVENFIYPLFVVPGSNVRTPIASMPDVFQLSIDNLLIECEEVKRMGIRAVILFGIPEAKDSVGSGAYASDGIIQKAVEEIKSAFPDLLVVTDVCLCEYTDHGHCGLLDGSEILNDETVDLLAATAVSHARAGADIIAPSDMMDGRVAAIRHALDENGYHNTPIMSYAVKYASAFYGPFREAVDSAPAFGDRRSHQMDPSNAREAIKEAVLDIAEGADIIMVKPAMTSLDIISELYNSTDVPIAAYQVSGEYSMIHAAAANGWLDLDRAMMESLTAIRRAGATIIITYFAKRAAAALSGQ